MEEEKKISPADEKQKADKYYEMIKRKRRHQAKSYGVKSVFSSEGKTIVTGYEPNNQSSVEAEFTKTEEDPGWKEGKHSKEKFDAYKEKKPCISVRPINAEGKIHANPVEIVDPSFTKIDGGVSKEVGMDQLRLKSELEKYYFDNEFPNDNLHIQIIYNILDVKKLFCLYANEMVSVLNNIVSRVEGESLLKNFQSKDKDYIGGFKIDGQSIEIKDEDGDLKIVRKEKEKDKHYLVFLDFLKALEPYNIFFDEIFEFRKKDSKGQDLPYNPKTAIPHNWNVIRACGFIRNYFCHFEYRSGDSDIIKEIGKKENEDVKKAIDDYAAKRLNQVETTFRKGATRNMEILLWTLDSIDLEINTDVDSRRPVIQKRLKSFHEFSIEKRGKNLGLRIPSIKEALKEKVSLEPADLMNHPERKGKFDNLLEYIIYLQIKENENLQKKTVESLRASQTDEEKETIYKQVADQLYEENADTFKTFKKTFDENIAVEGDKHWLFNPDDPSYASLNDLKKAGHPDYAFRNILIFLSAFLEQKECNELVTSLINKFENILSLYGVARENGLNIKISERAESMFSEKVLRKTVKGLYDIQGYFKLKKQFNNETKISLFADAFNIFKTGNKPNDFFVRTIDENGDIGMNENFEQFLAPMLKSGDEWHKKLKNYAKKNIVESRRFWYLVRYVKPTEVRKIMNNDKLVEYTLKRLPEAQVDRYCRSCGIAAESGDKVAALMKELKNLTFENLVYRRLSPILQNGNIEARKPIGASIGLYLTVAYLIVKNMVQVNARYMLAYACFDRDYFFFYDHLSPSKSEHYKNIVDRFLKEGRFDKNKHVKAMIEQNFKEYLELEKEMPTIAKEHRNKIEHLNYLNCLTDAEGIRNVRSYYDVYQYVVQKYWSNEKGLANSSEAPIFSAMKENLDHHHLPQEDFVKIINFPLSYCVPRYKNLTISFLFNARNEEPRD